MSSHMTMFSDMENPPNPTTTEEEQRALQIALELSNLGLLGAGDDDSSSSSYDDLTRSKKSQNMTECVPVPSSEHVAEIVGRLGCKIKALRAKTSTYIKTPVRGEEPVFVVTGRKEDVALARREIQSAAEHFTQIRATRNKTGVHTGVTPLSGLAFPMSLPSGNTSPDLTSPGTITLQVRVPYRVVGLVVGPKGATIKRIQQQTHTYIVTPSRDKEPVFDVTGLPENVEKAKEEIEAHIAARTGNQSRDIDDDFASNGTVVGSPASFNRSQSAFTPYRQSTLLGSRNDIYMPPPLDSNIFTQSLASYQKYPRNSPPTSLLEMSSNAGLNVFGQQAGSTLDPYEVSTDALAMPAMGYDAVTTASWSARDMSEVQSFLFNGPTETATTMSSLNNQLPLRSSIRLSPTLSDDYPQQSLNMQPSLGLQQAMPSRQKVSRVTSDSLDSIGSMDVNPGNLDLAITKPSNGINIESGYSSGSTTDSLTSGSPVENIYFGGSRSSSPPRLCVICKENAVTAALVPCGHNHFCMDCAEKTAGKLAPCPCCSRPASFALMIKT